MQKECNSCLVSQCELQGGQGLLAAGSIPLEM